MFLYIHQIHDKIYRRTLEKRVGLSLHIIESYLYDIMTYRGGLCRGYIIFYANIRPRRAINLCRIHRYIFIFYTAARF